MMCGGTGAEKEADKEVQALCDALKEEILEKANKNGAEMFKALKYKSQVVAGTNFLSRFKFILVVNVFMLEFSDHCLAMERHLNCMGCSQAKKLQTE